MDINDIEFASHELSQGGYDRAALHYQIKCCGGTCVTCQGNCPGARGQGCCGGRDVDGRYQQGWTPGRYWNQLPERLKAQRASFKKDQVAAGYIKKSFGLTNKLGMFPRAQEV